MTGSTPLRVLLLGYGFAGGWIHDPLLRATEGLTVAGVVTGDDERAALARSRTPDVEVFATAADALSTDAFDVAVVAAPNAAHLELGTAAIERGLAVVVDKPLAPTAATARLLAARARDAGVSLTTFHNRRWDGDIRTVARLIDDGALGDVHRFTSRFDRWVPEAGAGWRNDGAASGGGILLDLGSHLVDQALLLFGPVATVYAELATRRAGLRSDDDVFLALHHASGVTSHLHASAVEPEPSLRLQVSGSRAGYVKRGVDVQEERLLAGGLPVPGHSGVEPADRWGTLHRGDEATAVETVPGDWTAFYRQLVAHLRDGLQPPVPADEAVAVIDVLDAARHSADTGAVVAVGAQELR